MARMIDVARKAGVSIATVSNYLTGKKHVGLEKQRLIQKVIEECGYEVNIAARCLKSNRTYNIGVAIPEISSVYFTQIFNGLRDAADDTDYTFSFVSTNFDFAKEKQAISQFKRSRVDGILLNSCCEMKNKREWAKKLVSGGNGGKSFPVLSLEYNMDSNYVSALYLDNVSISREIAEYLLEKGCKDILYISAKQSTIVGHERLKGYKEALAAAHIPIRKEYIFEGNLSSFSGYKAVCDAFERGITFDAVMAVNDQSAIGALKALHEKKIKVPDEVMLTGCDNIFPGTLVSPQITTVNIPAYTLGLEGFKLLQQMIEEPDMKPVQKKIVHSFIERQSTNKNCESEWNLARW